LIEHRWNGRAVAAAIVLAGVAGGAVASTTGYDGVYRGDVTLTRGGESICGKPTYQVTYTVVNGQFSMMYDPSHHVGVNLVVAADGSFSGSQLYMVSSHQSQIKASGRIAGNVLDAQIEGDACARSYHLTKG
jgi:hypothetical protein